MNYVIYADSWDTPIRAWLGFYASKAKGVEETVTLGNSEIVPGCRAFMMKDGINKRPAKIIRLTDVGC